MKTGLPYIALFCIFLLRLGQTCPISLKTCAESILERNKTSNTDFKSENTFVRKMKESLVKKARQNLPSPHSELLLGMTLGIDRFSDLPIFSKMLRDTGTIHVVVVSGYNVTLVFTFLVGIIGSLYKRRNFILALSGTLLYAFLSGFDPPVVRAWLMGGVIMLGKYYGMRLNVFLILIFTALLLLIINPEYLFSLSFKLSFVATLSLVLFGNFILENTNSSWILFQDLKSTLAAQVLIWPVISFYFGQVSLISPFVNMLILWTVPTSTILGGIYIFSCLVPGNFIRAIVAQFVYVPLDIFVRTVELASTIPRGSVPFQLNLQWLTIYYITVGITYLLRKRKPNAA